MALAKCNVKEDAVQVIVVCARTLALHTVKAIQQDKMCFAELLCAVCVMRGRCIRINPLYQAARSRGAGLFYAGPTGKKLIH